MKNTIELHFCDYCEQSLETIATIRCWICEKDICKSCVDDSMNNYYGYNAKKPNCCKHCIDTVSNLIYRNDFKLPRLADYHMSWNASRIDIWTYYRYFYDIFLELAYKKVSDIFYETMKNALIRKETLNNISEKKKELEKEFQEKLASITNV